MSLQVWLPLNGDLHNQGLNPLSIAQVQSGVNLDNTGKLGKCYTNSGNSANIATSCAFSAKTFSVCAWVKLNTRRNNWCRAFGMSGNGTYFGFGCEHSNGNGLGFHYYKTINGTNTSIFDSYPVNISTGSWNHFAMCYDGVKYYIYQNGKLIKSDNANRSNIDCNMTTLYLFGGTANSYSQCSLNDVRIYDHCLSAKEVEEISKGLVLHYKLDNIKTSIWSLNYYKRTATLTTSNTYIYSLPSKTIYLTPGKQYTVGAQVRVNQDNIKFNFDTNCTDENGVYTGNDAAQTVQYNPTITLEKDTWTQVWVTTTIKSDAGKPYYHHGFLFKTISGELSTLCEIQNIEIYEGSAQVFTTYDKTNIVYDSSGYNNNGIIVGSLETIIPSPRYSYATHIPATSSKIHISNFLTSGFGNSYTFTWWGKRSSNNPMFWGFSDGIRLNGMYLGNLWNTGDGSSNPLYKIGTTTQVSVPSVNVWHHYVMVGNGSKCYVYLDGELWAEAKTYKAISGTSIYINGWNAGTSFCSDNTDISDFRVYATALTAEQIKELYNTSMTIDNQGNIHARELVE